MGNKLERLKVNPLDYNILDNIDIQERYILLDKDDKCLLKLAMYKWKGMYHLEVRSPLFPNTFTKTRRETKFSEESIYKFIAESTLNFKHHCPELFNNVKGFFTYDD